MKHLAWTIPALAACSAQQPLPIAMSVDNVPGHATVVAGGTRGELDVTIQPEDAVLAGQVVGTLMFRVGLAATPDCPKCLATPAKVPLDGAQVTGSFELGAATYDIESVVDPTKPATSQYYLFADAADPLHVPRGSVAAIFYFHHLDAAGASVQLMMEPLFGAGLPDPSAAHLLVVGDFDVTFQR
ncbi:MAG: hypothetical protein ACM31C_22800 [Acidobacteriota bacterium]